MRSSLKDTKQGRAESNSAEVIEDPILLISVDDGTPCFTEYSDEADREMVRTAAFIIDLTGAPSGGIGGRVARW